MPQNSNFWDRQTPSATAHHHLSHKTEGFHAEKIPAPPHAIPAVTIFQITMALSLKWEYPIIFE
jgi:hypothetical protein